VIMNRVVWGTRCETVHRPIAGVTTDDQAVSDADGEFNRLSQHPS
jgi:hypothetical protein